jgi:hypothetical protein
MISLNPKFTVRAVNRLVRRFFFNRGLRAAAVKHSPYILFNDGAHRNLRTYYIRPLEQLAQLQADFTGVRVFSLASGVEITDENELSGNEDAWLYYLCQLR